MLTIPWGWAITTGQALGGLKLEGKITQARQAQCCTMPYFMWSIITHCCCRRTPVLGSNYSLHAGCLMSQGCAVPPARFDHCQAQYAILHSASRTFASVHPAEIGELKAGKLAPVT